MTTSTVYMSLILLVLRQWSYTAFPLCIEPEIHAAKLLSISDVKLTFLVVFSRQ